MKIAIIGGGFTGLTAAYKLTQQGHAVTLFEKEKTLGGLAYGFNPPAGGWDWHLEGAYHHLFINDSAILTLINDLGLSDKLIIKRPITANYYKGKIYQLDSPLHLIQFPFLSPIDKFRTALLLTFCKLNPFWKPLESITAKQLFVALGGSASWRTLWEPLMVGKFGDYADTIAASWLWARIKKRTPRLAYIEGGFHTVVEALVKAIKKQGGKIVTEKTLTSIPPQYDRVLLTTPTPIAQKLLPEIQAPTIPHLWAQTLILETKEPILKDVYWLNVTERTFPFLAVVAHTNFMDKKHYGGNHITYLGNYLPQGHKYLSMTKEQLLKEFSPYIKKVTSYKLQVVGSHMFVGPFAQPIHQIHYSKKIPPMKTTQKNICLANMDSIVPWDRGTNYAVELGMKAATSILYGR